MHGRVELSLGAPLATLERAWSIGREAGLQFVYPGKVRAILRVSPAARIVVCY